MELDQLNYFVKVASLGSFTRAADELQVSQPALSRSIQRLEEELGMPLFVRKARSLELTDAGSLLHARAQEILSIIEDTKAQICDDGQSGRIRCGAIPTIAPYFLPSFLNEFAKEFPRARVSIQEETTDRLLKSCSQGEIDIALLAQPVQAKYLEVEPLFEEEILLVLPKDHALANKKKIGIEDVESMPFVMLDDAHCLSGNIQSFCRRSSFQPSVVGRTSQLSMVQELVALHHGISFVPKMASDLDTSKRRVYRSLSGTKPTRQIVMAWDPYRFQTRMMESFRDRLRQYAKHSEA